MDAKSCTDLMQSVHEMAEYHGAARAVGGCAIYVRYAIMYLKYCHYMEVSTLHRIIFLNLDIVMLSAAISPGSMTSTFSGSSSFLMVPY